jgi:hypothetical protein
MKKGKPQEIPEKNWKPEPRYSIADNQGDITEDCIQN